MAAALPHDRQAMQQAAIPLVTLTSAPSPHPSAVLDMMQMALEPLCHAGDL